MKPSTQIKTLVARAGLYRPARWACDRLLKPERIKRRKRLLRIFRGIVSPGDLCFDVGANIGDYTAAMAGLGARVVAFEPVPDQIDELRCRFGQEATVAIEPYALGSAPGKHDFYVREHRGASSLSPAETDTTHIQKITVDVRTISQAIAEHGVPSLIKIDVEGHELDVLTPLDKPIEVVSVEYHLLEADIEAKMKCFDLLGRFGALRFNIVPNTLTGFYWDSFVPADIFFQTFPAKLEGRDEYFYGDIFIRIE